MTKLTVAQKLILLKSRAEAESLPAPGTLQIHDTFTDVDTTEIESHTVGPVNIPADIWNHFGGLADLQVISNELHFIDASLNINLPLDIEASVADNLRVSCVAAQPGTGGSDSGSGPFLRGAPNNHGIRFSWESGNNEVELREATGGLVDSAVYSVQAGDLFLIRALGTTIQGWVNGVKLVEGISTYQQANTTVGLRFMRRSAGAAADIHIDEFKVELEP